MTALATFDPARLETFRLAYRDELVSEAGSLGVTPDQAARRADVIVAVIAKGQTCMAVVYLQSPTFKRVAKRLGYRFTIKASDAWLRGEAA